MKKLLAFLVLVTMCLSNFFVPSVMASWEDTIISQTSLSWYGHSSSSDPEIQTFTSNVDWGIKDISLRVAHRYSYTNYVEDIYVDVLDEDDVVATSELTPVSNVGGSTPWVIKFIFSDNNFIEKEKKYIIRIWTHNPDPLRIWTVQVPWNLYSWWGIIKNWIEDTEYDTYFNITINPNIRPNISFVSTNENYITPTNSWSFNIILDNINDWDNGNLDLLYSTDGTNYSNLDVELYKERRISDNTEAWSIVWNKYIYNRNVNTYTRTINQPSNENSWVRSDFWYQTFHFNENVQLDKFTLYIYRNSSRSWQMRLKIEEWWTILWYATANLPDLESLSSYNESTPLNFYFWWINLQANKDYRISEDSTTWYVRFRHSYSENAYPGWYSSEKWDFQFKISATKYVYTDTYNLDTNYLYKTDSKDQYRTEFLGIIKENILSNSTARVYIDKVDLSDTLTSDLIPEEEYYLSDTPGEFSTTPWTNSVLFWTAIDETTIKLAQSSIENAKADIDIDLSTLPEGNNTLYFKANDWEADSIVSTLLVLKDTVAPELSEINSIWLTNDSTPEFTFNSTEPWTIEFNGSCISENTTALIGENTIQLKNLSEGIYNDCSITVTDNVGNISDVLNISEFEIDTTGPITPTEVKYNGWIGYSTTMNFPLEITHTNETDVNLWCAISSGSTVNDCNFISEKPTEFSFTSDGRQQINFYLQDLAGNTTQYLPEENILIDTVDPVISIDSDFDTSYTNTWKVMEASVVDENLNRFAYTYVDATTTCDNSVYYENEYTGPVIADNELLNGQKVCFNAYDDAWRNAFNQSSVIENIDMSNPEEPVINSGQSKWNTFKITGTCTYEEWLQLVVLDNGVEIAREDLSDPCVLDFEYTLSDGVINHNIEYYLEDKATNKSLRQNSTVYVDASGVLITPQWGKTVEPIVTFFGYGQPNQEVKIKNTVSDEYIALGSTDANGVFSIQTTTSQALGNLSIDLELWGLLKNEPRTVTIEASSIIVPTIDENSVFSKYSGVKDIYSFEEQNISFTAMWEPLSKFKVYSYANVWEDRVITEIAHGQFDSNGNASVSSDVALPGGENEIMIIDTIHDVSSNIVYAVIADPFGVVYDSVTNQPIIGAKVSFCREWENSLAELPQLHGEDQPNPVITNSSWNYFSYHEVGNRYYICWVQANGYNFPSTKITSGTNNLDGTSNIGSHWQVFEIIPTPLHIDIPLDKKVEIQKPSSSGWWGGGWSWGWLSEKILVARQTDRAYSTVWDRQLMVLAQEGTKTEQRTRSTRFSGWVYAGDLYRVLYESGVCRETKTKCGIDFNIPLIIQITDKNLPENFTVMIRYDERSEWVEFNDYDVNDKTLIFTTVRGFEMKIENNISGGEEKNTMQIHENYDVKYFSITDSETKDYIIEMSKMNNKYSKVLDSMSDKKLFTFIPKVLIIIEGNTKYSSKKAYRYLYNFLGKKYEERLSLYDDI